MPKNNKQIIFVGNSVPQSLVAKNGVHNVNIADNIAQNTLIDGLHQHYGTKLTVISVSSDKNPSDLDLGYGVTAKMISSNNLHRAIYYISIAKNYTKKLNQLLRMSKDKRDTVVITNGPYVYMALPALIARWRYRVKWVPFLIGAVEIPEAKFPYNLISKMSRWTAKKADGAITYVAKSVTDYMQGKRFVEIFYLIDDKLMGVYRKKLPKKHKKFTITYTGALTDIYNLDIVIEAIKITKDRFHWVFAGIGPYAREIKSIASDESYDVDYLDAVSNIEAAELQRKSHLLLCLKGGDRSKINQYYSKYAASGKLIEYLCSGTPILAADIPAFSDTIKPFMTCEKDQSATQVVRDIERIERDYKDKQELAKKGQKYAFAHFNAEYQNKKIYEFLESL